MLGSARRSRDSRVDGVGRRFLRQRADGELLLHLKTELVYRRICRTREEAENALFAYVDGWYNRERIQARLGWRSPDEYEHTWHTSRAHPEPVPAR
ncbi:IS3 family transposase [Actinomycetospora sp. NBC_00405]